jgi:hypothetical protein
MEILSVLMVVTGALMLAHFVAFVRTRFTGESGAIGPNTGK